MRWSRAMSELADLLERALPKILQSSPAKQQAIGEAMTKLVEARKIELEATNMLLKALQTDYTWWVIEFGEYPYRHHASRPTRIPGCGNLDAVMRLRRRVGAKAARYIFSINPCDPETS
jgi:hypothetical protein